MRKKTDFDPRPDPDSVSDPSGAEPPHEDPESVPQETAVPGHYAAADENLGEDDTPIN